LSKASGGLGIQLHADVGLGTILVWLVELAWQARHNDLELQVEVPRHLYGQSDSMPEMVEFLLKRKRKPSPAAPYLTAWLMRDLPFKEEANRHLNFENARALFNETYEIREEFLQKAKRLADDLFGDEKVFGVHYRGGNKAAETEGVSAGLVLDALHTLVPRNCRKIFLATDDSTFGDKLGAAFPEVEIIQQEGVFRVGEGEEGVFGMQAPDGCRQVQEALLDMLLLGRTSCIVKTPSILSGLIPVICPGPTPPMLMVGRPRPVFRFFPDDQVPVDTENFREQIAGIF